MLLFERRNENYSIINMYMHNTKRKYFYCKEYKTICIVYLYIGGRRRSIIQFIKKKVRQCLLAKLKSQICYLKGRFPYIERFSVFCSLSYVIQNHRGKFGIGITRWGYISRQNSLQRVRLTAMQTEENI